MRYHVLATDYDGTLADQGQVAGPVIEKLRQLRASGRRLVLATGQEMKDLTLVFPDPFLWRYLLWPKTRSVSGTGKRKITDPAATKKHVLETIIKKYMPEPFNYCRLL